MNPDDNTTFPLSDDQIEAIACACHEVNRAYCAVIGDNSQVAWADAPEWQRESAKMGILRVYNNSTPEELHQSWCDQKVADGWRYGPFKDAAQKVHPCLVPYAELPAEQKVKDDLFQTTAGALIAVAAPADEKKVKGAGLQPTKSERALLEERKHLLYKVDLWKKRAKHARKAFRLMRVAVLDAIGGPDESLLEGDNEKEA